MTAPFALAGRLAGVQVWDWSDPAVRNKACQINPLLCDIKLRFDEMYPSYSTMSILVGEQAHFLWRQLQLAHNAEVRKAASDHIRREAERILGEPWKLSSD